MLAEILSVFFALPLSYTNDIQQLCMYALIFSQLLYVISAPLLEYCYQLSIVYYRSICLSWRWRKLFICALWNESSPDRKYNGTYWSDIREDLDPIVKELKALTRIERRLGDNSSYRHPDFRHIQLRFSFLERMVSLLVDFVRNVCNNTSVPRRTCPRRRTIGLYRNLLLVTLMLLAVAFPCVSAAGDTNNSYSYSLGRTVVSTIPIAIMLKNVRKAVAETCFEAKKNSDNERVPDCMVKDAVDEHNARNPGLGLTVRMVLNAVDYKWKRYKLKQTDTPSSNDTEPESDCEIEKTPVNKGPGRPPNTSLKELNAKKTNERNFMNALATAYRELRKDQPKVLADEWDQLVKSKREEYNIDKSFFVNKGTILKRVRRNRLVVNNMGAASPTHGAFEDAVIAVLVELADMNLPLSVGETRNLINELLEDESIGEAVVAYKKKMNMHSGEDGRNADGSFLGKTWWQSFMARNNHRLTSSKGRKFSLNREQWCTYDNFINMYKCIYEEMADAGVAEKLEVPVYMDADGNIVDKDKAYGRKCTHKLTRPEMCFVFDETGGNTCMKGDGQVGGRRFLSKRGSTPKIKASESDNHFTSLTVTSLSGEAALSVVIFKGKQPNQMVETGYDEYAAQPLPQDPDEMTVENCIGEGKAFPCGPVCKFQGKEIPTLTQWSEGGGITPEILTNILKRMDSVGVIDRSCGTRPFLLVDPHSSRVSLEFLNYINHEDHLWKVCIGVPYGTHKWQVADAEELNGELAKLFTLAKEKLLKKKSTVPGTDATIGRLDIMPMHKEAWEGSFGDVDNNKKAMAARGWGPLNYFILDDPEIAASMSKADMKREYTEDFGKHYGKSIPAELEEENQSDNGGYSPMSAKQLNFSLPTGQRVISDLHTGEAARQHKATIRERAKLNTQNKEAKKLADEKLFKGAITGGRLNTHNQFALNKSVRDAVQDNVTRKNIESAKSKIKKYDEFQVLQQKFLALEMKHIPFDRMKNDELKVVIAYLRPKPNGFALSGDSKTMLATLGRVMAHIAKEGRRPSSPPAPTEHERRIVHEHLEELRKKEEEARLLAAESQSDEVLEPGMLPIDLSFLSTHLPPPLPPTVAGPGVATASEPVVPPPPTPPTVATTPTAPSIVQSPSAADALSATSPPRVASPAHDEPIGGDSLLTPSSSATEPSLDLSPPTVAAKITVGTPLSDVPNDDADVDGTEDIDMEEIWELDNVLSPSAISKPNPIICGTEGCDNVACCVWKSTADSTEAWYSCVDCQEKDFAGGWPKDAALDSDHRNIIVSKCSHQKNPPMPKTLSKRKSAGAKYLEFQQAQKRHR